jgi:hypothetical protein
MHRRRLFTLAAAAALAVVPAAATAAKPGKSAVTIGAKPLTVTFGKATTIGGQATGNGAAGARVTLQHDAFPFDGKFASIATTTANAQGGYAFTGIRPAKNNHYRATAKTKPRATSAIVAVNVRPRVTLSVSDRTPKRGRRVRFHGTVLPAHNNGKHVLLQKRTSSGWKTVAMPLLKPATPLSGVPRSKYSRRLRVRASRSYRVVFVPADGDHVRGKSRKRHLTVH